MASPGNLHCANCICALSFPIIAFTAFTIYSQLLALLTISVLVAIHFSCILP